MERSAKRRLLQTVDHVLVGDYQIGQSGRRYLSLGLLIGASVIGTMSFTTGHWFFWTKSVSLTPDLFSGLLAFSLAASLYLRRLFHMSQSVYGILSLILNVTLTAMLIQGLLGNSSGFLTRLPMPYLVAAAVVFSWVGIRPLVPWIWGLTLVLGIFNLLSVSDVMGLWGYVMILAAGLGLALQIDSTAAAFREDLGFHFWGPSRGGQDLNP